MKLNKGRRLIGLNMENLCEEEEEEEEEEEGGEIIRKV